MDLRAPSSLRAIMMERDDSADRDDLTGRLFYLLTARFEDGATAAVGGQAGMDPAARTELANRLRSLAEEIGILADAVVELERDSDREVLVSPS